MEKKFILIFLLAFVVLPAALAIGQGEVIKTPNLQNYSHKKLLKLQAIPAPGWKFSHWEGDIQGNSNPVSFLITEDIHATAVFTEEGIYTLSVTNEGKGTVNISPSKTIFNPGAEVTLTAVAKPGWRFDRWEGATTGSQNPVVLSIQSDVSVKAVFVNLARIAAGGSHSLALLEDGTVWAWGDNSSGQLGDGATADRTTPVQVTGLSSVVAIAAGGGHSLALNEAGTVWAWGNNSFGQLGDGTKEARTTPVQVAGLSNVEAIAAGGAHSLALKSDGTVWAWGDNRAGQLADREAAIARLTPIQAKDISEVETIAAGFSNSLSLKKDGTVWVWGSIYGGDRMRYVRPYPSIMNIFISP